MSGPETAHPRHVARTPNAGRWGVVAFVAILLLALLPRAADLGGSPLWIDEDITWLAATGIVEEGVPRMPSGVIYTRAAIYSYITAGAFALGDQTVAALRAPSVVFSLALIVLMFFFGRAVGGTAVGLLAMAILAFSPWDVHYARMARMYEMMVLLFTLSAFFAYLGLMRGVRWARVLMLVTSVLCVFAHAQGAAFMMTLLLPFLFPRVGRPPLRWLVAGVGTVGVAFVAMKKITRHHYAGEPVLKTIEREADTGTISFPVVGQLDLNHARLLLGEVGGANAWIGILATFLVAGLCGWMIVHLARRRNGRAMLATGGFVVAMLVNQLVVAAILALVVIKLADRSPKEGLQRAVHLAISAGASVIVILGACAITLGTEALADRMLLRSFVAVPVPWYKLLAVQSPILLGVVVSSALVIFFRSLREGADQSKLFLAGAFLVPLLLMGLQPAPYFGYRYNFYLHPLSILLFAMVVMGVVGPLLRAIGDPNRKLVLGLTMVGVVTVLFCEAFDPKEAFAVRSRMFGYNRDTMRHPDLTASFNYDFPTTAAYVMAHREPADIVIVRDPVNLHPYTGPLDYVVSAPYDGRAQTETGKLVDWYTGIPYIPDGQTLVRVLEENRNVGRWIIYTMDIRPNGPPPNLTDDQLEVLTSLDGYRAYTGEDGATVVLRLSPGQGVDIAVAGRAELRDALGGTPGAPQASASRNRLLTSGGGIMQVSDRPNHR